MSGHSPVARIPFGRYILEERLARGGMGEVFRARAVGAEGFAKPVVVKRMLPQHAGKQSWEAMFAEEARLMSRLAHPNIVQVIDFGQGESDDYFLVLELIDGVDLGTFAEGYRRRSERAPAGLSLFVVSQMLRGLGFAHRKAFADGRLLVHRDISPSNVLLSRVGEVKLADFGVALVGREAPDRDQRSPRVGKPRYMAPEQYSGGDVDARADLFSVGVVLFELLTGRSPYDGEADEWQAQARAGRSSAESMAHLPATLQDLLARALAPDRADRFPGADEMSRRIEALRDQGVSLATSDELAAAVEQAAKEGPRQAKPVIALGQDGAAFEPRELTRAGPESEFTVRVSPAPPPGTDDPAEPTVARPPDTAVEQDGELAPPPVRSLWPPLLGVVAVVGVLVAGGYHACQGGEGSTLATSTTAPAAPPVEAPGGGKAVVDASPAGGAVGASAAATAVAPLTTDRGGTTRALEGDTGGAGGAGDAGGVASAAPTDVGCEGHVHLFASENWVVTGGPSVVQAPGRYVWPCGAYALHATSRRNGSSRQVQVEATQGSTRVVDLR